jgi:DNA repair protein RadC
MIFSRVRALSLHMDRVLQEQHLALAERHVAQGEKTIARQTEILAELERDGHRTKRARDLLRQFRELQAMFVADRNRLRDELGLGQPKI